VQDTRTRTFQAHEVGHHIQQVLGTSAQVDQVRRTDPDRADEASVRLELQADCDTFSADEV
jgi:predicted metalloprotease